MRNTFGQLDITNIFLKLMKQRKTDRSTSLLFFKKKTTSRFILSFFSMYCKNDMTTILNKYLFKSSSSICFDIPFARYFFSFFFSPILSICSLKIFSICQTCCLTISFVVDQSDRTSRSFLCFFSQGKTMTTDRLKMSTKKQNERQRKR